MPVGVAAYEFWRGDTEGARQFGKSWAVTVGSTEALKRITHVERPDRSNHESFPSGHASHAFAAATYMHRRHGVEEAWPGTWRPPMWDGRECVPIGTAGSMSREARRLSGRRRGGSSNPAQANASVDSEHRTWNGCGARTCAVVSRSTETKRDAFVGRLLTRALHSATASVTPATAVPGLRSCPSNLPLDMWCTDTPTRTSSLMQY